jgi:hypothetical protein
MTTPEGPSRLKGIRPLAPKSTEAGNEPSRLLGKSLEQKQRTSEVLNETNLLGAVLIQRDSGTEFTVSKINPTDRKTIVILRRADGASVSKEMNDLLEQLRTAGSPWRLK